MFLDPRDALNFKFLLLPARVTNNEKLIPVVTPDVHLVPDPGLRVAIDVEGIFRIGTSRCPLHSSPYLL
jgi:hypothetical protein